MPNIYSLVLKPIILFTNTQNNSENRESIDLSTQLESLLSSRSIKQTDFDIVASTLETKLKNFDRNIIEIGQYLNTLYNSISWRRNRITKTLRTHFTQNQEEYNRLFMYKLDNAADIDHTSRSIPQEFLNLASSAKQIHLINAWKEPSTHNSLLQNLYLRNIDKIYKKIRTKIQQQNLTSVQNLSAFPLTQTVEHTKNYSLINHRLNATNFEEIKATLNYLISNNNPTKNLYMRYLYLHSFISYHYNRNDQGSVEEMVFLKRGDCSEMIKFNYRLAKSANRSTPYIYAAKIGNDPKYHAFNVEKIGNTYHIHDQNKIFSNENFSSSIRLFFGSYNKNSSLKIKISRRNAEKPFRNTKTNQFSDLSNFSH